MATSFSCDGCGCAVEVPMVVGHVIKRDYCVSCEALAQNFVHAEEVLRVVTREAFVAKREKLIAKHGADGFKLPDVS